MQQPTEIESLYIDFDAFFANVEKQLCPELRNRPVGVIPLQSDHTSLIARCYLAKAAGLSRGTSVLEARERCPDIALPVARHDEYVRMHHQILDEVNRHVPVQKVWSVDEMECALIGAERQDCVNLAHRIREGLRTSIGAYVTPSIGLAPNQFLAKVAAEMDKPNGFVMLHPDDLPGRLFDLKLTDLPGISKGIEVRLLKSGITSVEALWNLAPKHARKIWGSVEGERFWAQLRGYRVSRPETVRRMFGHGRVLSREWREPANARDCLRLLTAKAARRLRREGYMATILNVGLTSAQNDRRGAHVRFSPASDDYTFLGHACTLFDTLTSQMHTPQFKKVSVSLMGIYHQGDCHEDLLEAPSNRANRQKWQTLTETMDDLNARYEACVVSLGMHRQPRGGYAGAKIAFGRVPDLMDFATTPEAAAGTPR